MGRKSNECIFHSSSTRDRWNYRDNTNDGGLLVKNSKQEKDLRRTEFWANRLATGLTEAELGKIFYMRSSAISRIESGQDGRAPTMIHLQFMRVLLFVFRKGLMKQLIEFLKNN